MKGKVYLLGGILVLLLALMLCACEKQEFKQEYTVVGKQSMCKNMDCNYYLILAKGKVSCCEVSKAAKFYEEVSQDTYNSTEIGELYYK